MHLALVLLLAVFSTCEKSYGRPQSQLERVTKSSSSPQDEIKERRQLDKDDFSIGDKDKRFVVYDRSGWVSEEHSPLLQPSVDGREVLETLGEVLLPDTQRWIPQSRMIKEVDPFWSNISNQYNLITDGDLYHSLINRGRRERNQLEENFAGSEENWDSGRYQYVQPLYVDEPHWVLFQRRGKELPIPQSVDEDDRFWVARGRRQGDKLRSSVSSLEDPFWAERGRQEHKFNRIRRDLRDYLSSDEPFWAARGRRNSAEFIFDEDPFLIAIEPSAMQKSISRNRREIIKPLKEPFWTAGGRNEKKEFSSEEHPLWTARGKKIPRANAFQELLAKVRPRGVLAEFDPFWAARGKRDIAIVRGLESQDLSWMPKEKRNIKPLRNLPEDPFWAARGKRVIVTTRTLNMLDPFGAIRGKRQMEEELHLHDTSSSSQDKRDVAKIRAFHLRNPFWEGESKSDQTYTDVFTTHNPVLQEPGKLTLAGIRTLGLQDPFWATRGKRNMAATRDLSIQNPLWAAMGRRDSHDNVENNF